MNSQTEFKQKETTFSANGIARNVTIADSVFEGGLNNKSVRYLDSKFNKLFNYASEFNSRAFFTLATT